MSVTSEKSLDWLIRNARDLDVEAERDNETESYQRALDESDQALLEQQFQEKRGLFCVRLPDGDDHLAVAVKDSDGDWVGACDCDGYEYHTKPCAHLLTIAMRDVLDEVAPIDDDLATELRGDGVEAEVVDHSPDADQDDVEDKDTDAVAPDRAEADDGDPSKSGPEPDVVDVEPQGSSAKTAPATTSDPFAQELAEDVPERFVMKLHGETYIRRSGYARIARAKGLVLDLDEVVGAHETDWEHAKYRATVRDRTGDVVVDGEVGSAHADVEDLADAEGELDELAATRAARRAVEWATGAGMTVQSDQDVATDGGQR